MKIVLISYMVLTLKNRVNLGPIWAWERHVHKIWDPLPWFCPNVGVWKRSREGSKRRCYFVWKVLVWVNLLYRYNLGSTLKIFFLVVWKWPTGTSETMFFRKEITFYPCSRPMGHFRSNLDPKTMFPINSRSTAMFFLKKIEVRKELKEILL